MKKYLDKILFLFIMALGVILPINTNAEVISGSATLDVERKVNDVTNPVTNTFGYTVEADASNPAAVTNLPTSLEVVFNATAPVSGVATETATLDLSAVNFTALGDYKFKITETSSTDSDKYPVDDKTYYMYVSVRNELDANNSPTGTLIPTLVSKAKLNDSGDKVDISYESDAVLTNIQISKTVTGNMSKTDKYFAFTVTIPGTTGDVYKITGAHSTDGSATVNESNYTVGTTTTIYLKHGQTVTIGKDGDINQIPVGASYTIAENADDYTPSVDGTSGANASKTTVAADDSNYSTNNVTNYVNNKEEASLTGLVVTYWPFVVLIALAGLGIYGLKKTAKVKE